MIDFAQCPECGQLVRVPHATRPCRFRCPECEKEFDDDALSDASVPELIPLTEEGELKLSNLEDTQRMPQVVRQPEGEAVLPEELVDVAGPRPALRRRPKKPMSRELVKIALGGVAGLIIAQLILWWLPGGWRRDPFRLAGQIPEVLQFVLPEGLRSKPDANGGTLALGDNLPDTLSDADDSATLVDLPPLSDSPLPGYEPSYSASELQTALIAMGTLLQDQNSIETLDRESRRLRFRELYEKLCDVAQIATFVNVDDREIGKMMRATEKLLTRISNSSDLMDLVNSVAANWIHFPSRNSDGVALAGQVVEINAIGDRYNVQIQLPGQGGPTVHVVRDVDPALDPRHAFRVGQEILVLGSILSDPQARSSRIQYGIHLVLRTGG